MQNLLDRFSFDNFDPRISRRNLSYFFAAAKLGNFTKAAKICGVAQPSLSRGIVLLEDAIETKLFERTGRRIEVTSRGRELLPQVELYLNQCVDFASFLGTSSTGETTELKIAAMTSLTADVLPALLNRFEAVNSGIKVTLLDGINPEIVEAVEVGGVDLGIITTQEDPSRFRSRVLFRDQFCLVVNHDHSLHPRKTVRWEELNQLEIAVFQRGSNTYDTIDSVFRTVGMFFVPAACVRFRDTLMGLVQHRGHVTILPKLVVQEQKEGGIRAIPLIDPTVHRTYYLVERKDRLMRQETSALEAFLRFEFMAFEKLARDPRNLE